MVCKTIFNLRWCFFRKVLQSGSQFSSKSCSHAKNDIIFTNSTKKTRPVPKKKLYAHIIDSKAAELIACHVAKDWKDGLVLEANPGPGKLSSHLLKKGIGMLCAFEKNKDFLPELRALKSEHPNLDIIEEDLLFLPLFESKSFNETHPLDSFFQNIPDHKWTDDIPLRVFSIISNERGIKFLRYLLAALTKRSSIFAFGRSEFFLLTIESEFMYMTAVPKENFAMYRWSTVLYNLFFDVKYLEKGTDDSKSLYLVQLTPKKDIFSNKVNQNKLPEFYFFVRHHFIKRKALVIPTLEGWVPRCGPRLIKEGMNVFTKFGDLSPYQILLLFNQFSSWPEYADSAFSAAASRYLGRENLMHEDSEKEPENMD